MLVYMPGETWTYGGAAYANDGGQRWTLHAGNPNTVEELLFPPRNFKAAAVLAARATDDVNYIKGDLTNAYSLDKVEEYQRSMLLLTDRKIFAVFDKIRSADASYKKSWLLHSITEPAIDAQGVTTIINNGGKLTNTPLYPEVTVEKVGGTGHRFDVGGTEYPADMLADRTYEDYEAGSWRIQQSPVASQNTDVFLNVMTIGDEGETSPVPIGCETAELLAAKVDDVFIAFSKTGEVLENPFQFTVTDAADCYITDIKNGRWTVSANGSDTQTITAADNIARFETPAGTIRLAYAGGAAPVEEPPAERNPLPGPAAIRTYMQGEYVAVDWSPVAGAAAYDVKIDAAIYRNASKPFVSPVLANYERRVLVRAAGGEWSEEAIFRQFDERFSGALTRRWLLRNSANTSTSNAQPAPSGGQLEVNNNILYRHLEDIDQYAMAEMNIKGKGTVALECMDFRGVKKQAARFDFNYADWTALKLAVDVGNKVYSVVLPNGNIEALPFLDDSVEHINNIYFDARGGVKAYIDYLNVSYPTLSAHFDGVEENGGRLTGRLLNFSGVSAPVSVISAKYDNDNLLAAIDYEHIELTAFAQENFSVPVLTENYADTKLYLWIEDTLVPLGANRTYQ
jgi:hypothetical protein